MTVNIQSKLTIALLPWGNLIEDFLDTINVSFESFCQEMTGGWLFGYIEALKLAEINTVLYCISGRVDTPTYHNRIPTGAKICVLPAPKSYHSMRRPLVNPYGWDIKEAVGDVRGLRRWQLEFYRHTLPYLATPLRLLAKQLKEDNVRAILCQEYEYARFDTCVLAGKLANIPVFATFQGGDFQLSYWERFLRPFTIHACAGLIIPTQTEIERVKKKYFVSEQLRWRIRDRKIAKIFNPMNVQNWHAIDRHEARKTLALPKESLIVVWHGRVDILRKGLDILLNAWELLTRTHKDDNLTLLLIGTGKEAEQLDSMIKQKKLKNIFWINEYILDRNKIRTYLSAADVYTLPSRHEGFPVAPIEAMACGLPIVAADAPGIPDILENGELSGGLMVAREDAVALADGIKKVLGDRNYRKKLGKRARHRIENHFSLEAVAQQLHDFLG